MVCTTTAPRKKQHSAGRDSGPMGEFEVYHTYYTFVNIIYYSLQTVPNGQPHTCHPSAPTSSELRVEVHTQQELEEFFWKQVENQKAAKNGPAAVHEAARVATLQLAERYISHNQRKAI